MSIKFPKVHIATSVVNRILDVADGISRMPALVVPNAPEPLPQGAQLDAALAQPTPAVGAVGENPDSDENNAFEAAVSGGSSLDGLVDAVSGR